MSSSPAPTIPSLSITLRRKPPKPRYLGPSDNGGGGGTGTGGSYAIIKGDISTLYKDMSYLKSCKLTSLSQSPSIFVLLLLSPSLFWAALASLPASLSLV